jgi:hypothetical protein
MPRFSAPIPSPTPELEPLYNHVVRKYGVTAGRVMLKLIETDPGRCSIWDLRDCAKASGNEVLKGIRQFMADDQVREQLRQFCARAQ